jgi:hypothetical protein
MHRARFAVFRVVSRHVRTSTAQRIGKSRRYVTRHTFVHVYLFPSRITNDVHDDSEVDLAERALFVARVSRESIAETLPSRSQRRAASALSAIERRACRRSWSSALVPSQVSWPMPCECVNRNLHERFYERPFYETAGASTPSIGTNRRAITDCRSASAVTLTLSR